MYAPPCSSCTQASRGVLLLLPGLKDKALPWPIWVSLLQLDPTPRAVAGQTDAQQLSNPRPCVCYCCCCCLRTGTAAGCLGSVFGHGCHDAIATGWLQVTRVPHVLPQDIVRAELGSCRQAPSRSRGDPHRSECCQHTLARC